MYKIIIKYIVVCFVVCYILVIVIIMGFLLVVCIYLENLVGKWCFYGKGVNLKVIGVIGFLMKSIILFFIIVGLYLYIIYKMKMGFEVGC